jgi:hypothetical protein
LPPCLPPPEVRSTDGMSCGYSAPSWFAVGAEVEIVGLTKMPAFNGLKAIVQGREEASGRYNVLFEFRDASGPRLATIRGENLLSTREAPPALAALSSEVGFHRDARTASQAHGLGRIA